MQNIKYNKCENCKSIKQAEKIYINYSNSYYSLNNKRFKLNIIESLFIKLHTEFAVAIYPLLASYLRKGVGPWLNKLTKNSVWLDYGSGNGALTISLNDKLHSQNFFYDPFATIDSRYRIRNLSKIPDSTYDLITMSHCLEHADNPEIELNNVYRILKSNGIVVVRIPIASKFWLDFFGNRWSQLDPEFHQHIPTINGISTLIKSAGFEIDNIIYDGTDFPWSHIMGLKSKINNKIALNIFRVTQGFLNYIRLSDQVALIAKKK